MVDSARSSLFSRLRPLSGSLHHVLSLVAPTYERPRGSSRARPGAGGLGRRPGGLRGAARLLRVLLAAAFWVSIVPIASANPWLLPRVEDGRGIKLGQRSTFHPGGALGVGVDSNVFFEDRREDPAAAAMMLATIWGGIGNREVRDGILMTPPERTDRRIDYNIHAIAGFRQFMTPQPRLRDQSRFSFGAEARLAVLPGRRFSVELDDRLYRLSQPRNIEAGAQYNFNRVDQNGVLRIIGRPGGGRLSLTVGYLNQVLFFENRDLDVARNDRTVNGVLAETKWRFLPKSSVFARYSMQHTYYLFCCADVGNGRNEDNFAHRILGGYMGQVLKKVVLTAEAGWGLGYYRIDPNGPDFSGFLARVAADYFPSLRTRVHLSAERRFQDSLFGNYFVDWAARSFVVHHWRWRMRTALGLDFAHRVYHGLPEPGFEDLRVVRYSGLSGTLERTDWLLSVDARIEQPLGRFFVLAASYDLQLDSTNFAVTFANYPTAANYGGFVRHIAMLLGAARF